MLYGIIQNSHLGVVVRVEFPDELQYLRSEAGRVVGPALRRAEVAFVLALPSAVHAAPLVCVLCQHIYRLLFQLNFFTIYKQILKVCTLSDGRTNAEFWYWPAGEFLVCNFALLLKTFGKIIWDGD
jgi:hypothetical protein